ncbi:MAG: trigger factor [Verrucomicrobia bacterium]|nr:trigger factor [Verrucomicrobiota bacterium]
MNVQSNNVSVTRKNIVVSLEASEVDAEHREVAKEIADEFKQKVVAKAYRAAVEQDKVDVINIVKVEEGTVAQGTAASVTFVVDVRPEFTLPDYQNLPTEVMPTDATEAEVDRVIEGLRADRADFKTADRASQKGDYVKLAYEGTSEGKAITELAPDKQLYGKVPQTWEEVEGENEGVIPGLGRQLAGLKAGDKKEIKITFPADFAAVPVLAGKTATYAVEIQEIRERVLPPLDAAFFQAQNVADLEALKKKVQADLKLQKEYQNRAAQRRQVTERLGMMIDLPVPESLVEVETQGVLRNFLEEQMRRGVPQEQFEKDKRELFEGAKKAATNRVKLQLILAKIAEQEKIEVTNDDLNNFIYREAMRSQQKPDKVAKVLAGDRERLRSVQQSIIFDKAVDFLISKAKVTVAEPKA